MSGRLITLGDLPTFNTGAVVDGVVWKAVLDGWDSPDLIEDVEPKAFAHGLHRGTSYYGGRPLALRGSLRGSDPDAVAAARELLVQGTDLTDTDALLVVDETPAKQCAVRRSGRLGVKRPNPKLVMFDAGLLAADPRKYASDLEHFVVAADDTDTGTVLGMAETPVRVRTEAVVYAPLTFTDDISGLSVTISPGVGLEIDAAEGTVAEYVSGDPAWHRLDSPEFFTLRGGDAYSFTTSGGHVFGTDGGSVHVYYRPAWM